jgi:glycosyltransferase involved in cell wall biosynthesis
MTNHTNRTRVVHIVPSLVIGGMEQVVKTLCLGLDPEKFEVSVICIIEKGVLAEDLEKRGIGVNLTQGKRYKVLSHFYPSYLENAIKGFSPQIIHSHSGIWYASANASRMAGVPIMLHTEHGRHFPEKKIVVFFDKKAIKLTDRLVCVSEDLSRYMADKVKVPKNRIEVIKNGIMLENYKPRWITSSYPLRNKYGIPEDAKVLVSVGRLETVKGQKYLIEAFEKLVGRHKNIFLWIIGDGSLRGDLFSYVKSQELENSVFFTGNVNNVTDYLRESDVFILPSLSEGTPMALLEAMASGLTIVATRVGENEIALEHGRAGFLIPPGSVEELRSIIISILENSKKSREMGEEAHKLAYQKFSSKRMVEKYEELYLRLLQNKCNLTSIM